jgi:DNA-binding transcriptional MerR regulator
MAPELTIGAVSKRTGVAASALRFYETEGLTTRKKTI